jgi:pyruvate/2-oxoglutarate dehydrogenase complex dihydrolipoamide dehydrogenase (E3) component
MKQLSCDILVIGAGSGGLSVAAGAAQMGARVVLVEGHKMGGDCLNYGCVPSKALLAAARAAHAMTDVAKFGISDVVPQVDYGAVMDHVADSIAQIAPMDSQQRFEGLGVQVLRGMARFVSDRVVEVAQAAPQFQNGHPQNGHPQNHQHLGTHQITARRIVVATGSTAMIPPIDGLDQVPYLTNETLWTLRERPSHLIVLGGGPIGVEMAQAHRRLGCKVTLIEADTLLNREDPEMVAPVLTTLQHEGVNVITQTRATKVTQRGDQRVDQPDNMICVATMDGQKISGSHLLVALGRRPNVDALNLQTANITVEKQGIVVDRGMRTSNRRVYAIGDVAGQGQFTHLAGYHATLIIRNAVLGLPAKGRSDHIPRVIYCDPELAQIGQTEAAARMDHGAKLSVVRFDIAHNDRAIAERRAAGLVKVMVVNGRPVGVSIVGPQAGELINMWALVLANRLTMAQVAAMVSPYPTLTEVNKRAAGAYFAPKLFENETVKRLVRLIQRWMP